MPLKRNRRRVKIGPTTYMNLTKNGGYSSTTHKFKNQTFTQGRKGSRRTTNYGGFSDVIYTSYARSKARSEPSIIGFVLAIIFLVGVLWSTSSWPFK
jgi:hypothetical protein